MKDDFDKKPKRRTGFQHVPLFCFDYKYIEPKDEQVAANWAWAAIGRLACLFCEQYCDRASCNVEDSIYLPNEIKYNDRKDNIKGKTQIELWEYGQNALHRALAFLPNLKVEYDTTCYACNILMGLAMFPRLILYSPVPPIATIKRHIGGDGKKAIRRAGMKDISIPCHVVEFIDGDKIEKDTRIREDVLLKFDANNLPGITPDEYEILTRYLTRAHSIVKGIYSIAYPDNQESSVITRSVHGYTRYLEDEACFKRQGKAWLLVYEGTAVYVIDRDGMLYLAHLLENPGKDIHSVNLRFIVKGEGRATIVGSAGEIYDQKALNDFGRRLREIEADMEEAETNNDRSRLDTLREEKEQLNSEIGKAVGLGGRKRKASNDRERARQSVHKSIYRALSAIEKEHKPLWLHLKRSISTGVFNSYNPNKSVSWTIKL